MAMETYQGYVKTPGDAVVLFEACRLGLLPRVQRRLSEKERQLIKSGSVFVWDEREAGMRRWTDGKSWSASRVNGSFLTYREMEGKRAAGSYSNSGASSTRRNASPAGSQGEAQEAEGSGEGPDGYRYKPDGLTKQSFSITTSLGQHLHLISYFSRSHLSSSTLLQPSQDPQLRGIRPPKGMYPESSVQDNQHTPAMTRSPMVGPPFSDSSQPPSAASSPQYAQPGRSHGTQAPPGYDWPPSPMSTPPTSYGHSPYQYQHSPYTNGHPSTGPTHSPLYQSHSAYAHHSRPPPGLTDFDRPPPPMGTNGVPPPPPPSYGRNAGYPPIAPAPAPPPPPPNYPTKYSIPPQPPPPPRQQEFPPPPPQYHQNHQHREQCSEPYRETQEQQDSVDPRLASPPTQLNPLQHTPNQDSSRPGTSPNGQQSSSGAHTIPSIGSLIHAEPSDPSPGSRSRVGSVGGNGYHPANGDKAYNEDTRALRQLDKAFSQPTRHRPRSLIETTNRKNSPSTQRSARLYGGNPQSNDSIHRPFKCPGSATARRTSDKPARKRRKVSYADGDGDDNDGDGAYTNDDRLALGTRDMNRFPVFKPRDKDVAFRQKFAVPLSNKENGGYHAFRPPPLLGMRQGVTFVAKPLHDPAGDFAIVLFDPTLDDKPVIAQGEGAEGPDKTGEKVDEEGEQKLDVPLVHRSLADILGLKKKVVEERKKVPVVIDPRLAKVLRPHQVEGVKVREGVMIDFMDAELTQFLYRCTTGLVNEKANGCIMADEMGLGKTLQCITLMWTLLKQSPDPGKSAIQKCVIACPSSLVRNWANELVKWLGKDAIIPFAIDGKASKEELIQQLRQWCIASGRSVVRPVLIVSYETLRLNVDELKGTPIGLLLCDEGHRLKNGESQTFTSLNGLNVQKRVILSGTPIQNDLSEYFSLLNFANPNLLGSRAEFRKKYEIPILRGRDADGSDADRQRGDECLNELLTLVNKFIIRRTNDILSKYLPVKYEHVVFCHLSPFQRALYKHFIASPDIRSLLRGKGSQPLKAIGLLKKLCNHPDLLDLPSDLPGCEEFCPEDFVPKDARGRDRDVRPHWSGKMLVLDRMLAHIHATTTDKIVLISNYTQTLDVFSALCRQRGYTHLRLDGTMSVPKRQKLVDRFNDASNPENPTVFLLSSKAGGCGINLIGANRLVLFDPDWNPAADQQALARVWRDGQRKDCFVYRFIATGSIEEKIFQRQSHKQSLSSCVVDGREGEEVERHFSGESLRELFELREGTRCDTHDKFRCGRCGAEDGVQRVKAPAMLYGDTNSWNHFVNGPRDGFVGDGHGDVGNEGKREGTLGGIQDHLLKAEAELDQVSAVFQYISH